MRTSPLSWLLAFALGLLPALAGPRAVRPNIIVVMPDEALSKLMDPARTSIR